MAISFIYHSLFTLNGMIEGLNPALGLANKKRESSTPLVKKFFFEPFSVF